MMNNRHLTADERASLAALLEGVGPVEIIRLVAIWIQSNHPRWQDVTYHRDLMRTANTLNNEKTQ
jgi:hypothetical protein